MEAQKQAQLLRDSLNQAREQQINLGNAANLAELFSANDGTTPWHDNPGPFSQPTYQVLNQKVFDSILQMADKFAIGPGCAKPIASIGPAAAARGIASFDRLIALHEAKIAAFKAKPTIKPGMERLPKEIIEKQQAGRIEHWEKEIRTFKENIEKLRKCTQ
ncbi:MAG: hypothetical protein ABSH53_23175 [Holophaga sp.]